MKEQTIESYLGDEVRKMGGECLKWGQNGWPDRVIALPGNRVGFIELKRPGEEPEPLQYARLRILERLGIVTGWASTFDQVQAFLARFDEPLEDPAFA